MAQVFKDRGFGESKIDKEKGTIETDYIVQENWRTKITATVKKVSRREREVTLTVLTEKKVSGPAGWKAQTLMGQEQYERFFSEIELQIYRELAKGE